jgi:hypothetical protein
MLASTVKLCKLVITTTLQHMCFGGKDAEDVGQLGCMHAYGVNLKTGKSRSGMCTNLYIGVHRITSDQGLVVHAVLLTVPTIWVNVWSGKRLVTRLRNGSLHVRPLKIQLP